MTALRPSPSSVDRRVLLDPALDELLHRDGFVKFPLLDAATVARLRAAYGELRGWEGTGFQSDLVLDDTEYRTKVQGILGAAVDELAVGRFDGFTPFLHSYLVKFPGDDSDLYVHEDWMYVDERNGDRTYVVWIALDDITGHNGQLRVLRGSHLLESGIRGTDLIAPWLGHTKAIDDRMVAVPVEAGECIVFDNRLVHASYPNYTDQPRVAVAVGLRPTGVPLTYFRRSGPDSADRYEIDESFFLTTTPQGLFAEAPDLPVVETVPVGAVDLSAEELAAALDHGVMAKVDLARNVATRVRAQVQTTAVAAGRSARQAARQAVADRRPTGPSLSERLGAAAEKLPSRDELVEKWHQLPSTAAMGVLATNEAVINKFGPDTPAIWDPHQFDWARRIEAGYPKVRAEVEALLEGPTEIPHIEDVTGGIPQGNIGPWRSFVLMHQGRWIDWNCERCPETTELVRSVPGLTMAGFSVLEPGTHITVHRGPNKGALRYQLGVIVPGEPGDCRIRVGDEMIVWADGEGCMFDFTVPHEAWNDSDGIRVLLMLEVVTPLPWYLDRPNRLAQHAMGWFPTTRDITNRLRALEPKLAKR